MRNWQIASVSRGACPARELGRRSHGKFVFRYALAACSLIPAATVMRADESKEQSPPRLLVPAYFYPAGEGLTHWNGLIAAADKARITAIVNPATGPGKQADPNYVDVIGRAQKAGVQLIGYVTSSYAKRPIADIQADVDQWLKLYPQIEGVFVDEQTSAAEQVELYAKLYTYVRKEKQLKLVVSNPGTICAEEYLARPAADVVCLFEGPQGLVELKRPAWTYHYQPDRFAALAYGVKAGQWSNHLETARKKLFGWTLITDATGANPWDRLPSYWRDEVRAVSVQE